MGDEGGIERDAALFALVAKFFSETAQRTTPANGSTAARVDTREHHNRGMRENYAIGLAWGVIRLLWHVDDGSAESAARQRIKLSRTAVPF